MDSLTIRALREEDYHNILTGWWNDWGWTPPPIDFLPEDGTGGVIVMDGDTPVCAGFMYATNSRVAWVDWIISNKNYTDRSKRKEALVKLVACLTEMCRSNGYLYCYALIKNESLINTYKELGYLQAETYSTEMIKHLG